MHTTTQASQAGPALARRGNCRQTRQETDYRIEYDRRPPALEGSLPLEARSAARDKNMATNEYAIPLEFHNQLIKVDCQDTRTDSEILATLKQHVPVASEKNIWAYWHGGLDQMPSWCQRNVIGWVRMCNGWTVRVLDRVSDSPNNASNYIPNKLLPEAFVRDTMTGPYKGQHSKDLLSCACLYLYGGAFLDVGILLLRHLDRLGWDKLENPHSPYRIAVPLRYGQQIANHFIMSRKGDQFIKRWHELFVGVWRGRSDYKGIMEHPLLAFVKTFDFNDPRAAEYKWRVDVDINDIFAYAAQVLCFLRLTLLEGNSADSFNGTEYWENSIFLFDALQECFAAEKATDFDGGKIDQALSTRLDADHNIDEYQQAHRMVWDLLSNSSMMKVTRGSGLSDILHLGALWDRNPGRDIEPGTFAALLRHGSVHFQQTRSEILQVEAQRPAQTSSKAVLEP